MSLIFNAKSNVVIQKTYDYMIMQSNLMMRLQLPWMLAGYVPYIAAYFGGMDAPVEIYISTHNVFFFLIRAYAKS